MRFATFHLLSSPDMEPGSELYSDAMEQIRLADDIGIARAWFAEHHFSNYGYSTNPLLPIVKAATLTKNIRFGPAILVLPVWNPVRLAEDIVVTDILTEGRLDVGIGRGYQVSEFEAFGVEPADTRQVFTESLEIMRKCWTEEDWTYEGQHRRVTRPVTVLPRTYQKPYPPLFVAATSPDTLAWAAENDVRVLSSAQFLPSEGVAQAVRQYREALVTAGRSTEDFEFHSLRYVHVARTDEEARKHIAQTRWQSRVGSALREGDERQVGGRNVASPRPNEVDDETWAKRLLFGSPETVIEGLVELGELGVTDVICYFDVGSMPQDDVMRSMELFGSEVMPAVAGLQPGTPPAS